MEIEITHYQILEVDSKASQADIRKKYLELAFIYHPDKNNHLARDQYLKSEHKFQLITRAFQVLSDPEQRSKYDQHLQYTEKKHGSTQQQVFCSYKNGSYSFNISPVIMEFANKLFSNQKMQNLKDFLNVFGQFATSSGINRSDANLSEIIRNYKVFYQKKEQDRKLEEEKLEEEKLEEEKLGRDQLGRDQLGRNQLGRDQLGRDQLGRDQLGRDQLGRDQLVKKPKNNVTTTVHQQSSTVTKNKVTFEDITASNILNAATKNNFGYNLENNLENPSIKNSEDNLIYTVNVSLSDIYFNVKKVLNVPRKRVCDHCLGVGYLGYGPDMSLCLICKGLMIISYPKIFPIDIKKTKILFENEGNQRLGYLPGDLIIYVQPKPHPTLKIINNYDILYTHQISFIELYQYLEIQYTHLDNKIYNIIYDPEDANNLKDKCLLKIKEKGLLIDDGMRRGNLYIQLKIKYPDLTRNQFVTIKQTINSDSNSNSNSDINELNINTYENIAWVAELPDPEYSVNSIW